MRITIRDIITNALDEAKLVNRNQPVPGNIFVSAYSLLQKRLSQYSNTNLLSFARKDIDFVADKEKMTLGEYVLSDEYVEGVNFFYVERLPEAKPNMTVCTIRDGLIWNSVQTQATQWTWMSDGTKDTWNGYKVIPDVEVHNLQEVVRVYVGTDEKFELKFVAYEDFYNYSNGSGVYSILPKTDTLVELYLKPSVANNSNIKVIYNEAFDFDADSELNIPNQFVALFTAGLVYDLALQFPRLSDNTVTLLKQCLDELEENVRRSSSVSKFIARDYDTRTSWTYADGIAGRFLGV